jgi:hypothetical protein
MLNEDLKVGDYINAAYKCYAVSGIITKVNKNTVTVIECRTGYTHNTQYEITKTNNKINITKSRIFSIGLDDKEFFIN